MSDTDIGRAIYMVGLQQSGGMWNCTGKYYTDYDKAMKEVEKDRADGIKSAVFTIYPYK